MSISQFEAKMLELRLEFTGDILYAYHFFQLCISYVTGKISRTFRVCFVFFFLPEKSCRGEGETTSVPPRNGATEHRILKRKRSYFNFSTSIGHPCLVSLFTFNDTYYMFLQHFTTPIGTNTNVLIDILLCSSKR